MKKKFLLIILLSPIGVFAQKSAKVDSLASFVFQADSVKWAGYNFAKQMPFWIDSLMPANYNQLTLGYNRAKGKFISIQDATEINSLKFATEGITTVKKLKLWGSFSLDRVQEDSTRWAHQTRNNPTVPYYFGSIVNNKYYRTVYQLKALLSQNLYHQNWPLSLRFDYRIGNHYTNNDPRGNITDYQFNVTPGIGYKAGKWQLNAAYMMGYGRESVNIAYKNEAYYNSNVYLAYNNQFIKGYGTFNPHPTNRNYDNDILRNGARAAIQYVTAASTLIADFAYHNEKQHFNRKELPFEINGETDFYYYIDNVNASLAWFKKFINQKQLALQAGYQNTSGHDFREFYQVKNYTYNNYNNYFKAIYSIKTGNTQYNYKFNTSVNGETRKDGFQGNNISYNHWITQAVLGQSYYNRKKQVWGWDAGAGYRYMFSNQLTLTANDNLFASYVVYHDYLYNSSDAMLLHTSFSFSKMVYNGINAMFKIKADYAHQLNQKPYTFAARSVPGKNRLDVYATIGFYF